MPGRLHRWKRVDLIIRTMKYVDRPLTLKITGTGEDEAWFHELAKDDKRIEFLGRVTDEELIGLYADAAKQCGNETGDLRRNRVHEYPRGGIESYHFRPVPGQAEATWPV